MRPLIGLVLASCLLLSGLTHARAEGADSVHGVVGTRGNYYFENSTRVVAPAVNAALVMPSGVRVEGTYLLDAITSASQATGVQSDVGFTEIRNDVQAGLGYEIDFGLAQLDLSVGGRFSKEPDYRSRGLGFTGALSLLDRTTTFRSSAYWLHDEVSKIDRMAPSTDPENLMATDPVRKGTLKALSLGFALDQVLTPTTIATLGYDGGFLDGFQANVYRTARFQNGGAADEAHPRVRNRHAYYAWLAQYIMDSRSTVRVGYRLYKDNWDLLAHAPEIRFHQEIGRHAELRLRYRYYTQNSSFFWRKDGNLRADKYRTADPKMSAFHNQTLGMKMRLALAFLAFTPLDFARLAVLDFGVEYIFNTNRFGKGVIGQGGLTWPF